MKKNPTPLRDFVKKLATVLPLVVVLGIAVPACPVAAAPVLDTAPARLSPKWPDGAAAGQSDTLRREVVLVPENGRGAAESAELLLVYQPRNSRPSTVLILFAGGLYPVTPPQGDSEEGTVDIGGVIFRYRRMKPYER